MNAPDQPPYPGLRPFRRDESEIFFGRDDCVDEMISRLAATRFLAVLGSSGTGKSSLVKTGLLTGLEMGLSGMGASWRVVDFTPGRSAITSLTEALIETDTTRGAGAAPPDAAEVARLRERLAHGGPRALIEWCREGHLESGTNLLLLVDQFEELFRYQDYAGREEAEAFVSLLLESRRPIEAAHPQLAEFPIFVAITMRSEYLGPCALIEGLAEAINEGTFLTPRMTRSQCEEAIVGPARVREVEIEPRLVARMLNDLAKFAISWDGGEKPGTVRERSDATDQLSRLARSADQLPLMQHALNRMWHRARAGKVPGEKIVLKADDYRGLEQELNDHAESIVKELGPKRESAVEIIFRAVTRGTTIWNAERRRTPYPELVALCGGKREDVDAVVGAFAAAGAHFLYRPDDKDVDISHESLIRQWKQLSVWLEKEGRVAHEWQRLDAAAEQEAERKGELLTGRNLGNALALVREEKRPREALARRYGIDLGRIQSFLDRSKWTRRARWAAACLGAFLLVGAGSWIVWNEFEKAERQAAADQLKELNVELATANQKNMAWATRNEGFREASLKLGKDIEGIWSDLLKKQMRDQQMTHVRQIQGYALASDDDPAIRALNEWRGKNEQLLPLVLGLERFLNNALEVEPGNIELLQQHTVVLALISILHQHPYSDDAIVRRTQVIRRAANLYEKAKRNFKDAESIYASLTLLSIALTDAASYNPPISADADESKAEAARAEMAKSFRATAEILLDDVIDILKHHAAGTHDGRNTAIEYLAAILLRKCHAFHKRQDWDGAVKACTEGLSLKEKLTKRGLHEALWVLYDRKARLAAADERKAFHVLAIEHLSQYIEQTRGEFAHEFAGLLKGFPGQYLQEIGNPAGWAKSGLVAILRNWPLDIVRVSKTHADQIREFDNAASSVANLAELYEQAGMVKEARVSRFLQFLYHYAHHRMLDESKEMKPELANALRNLASANRRIARTLLEFGDMELRLGELDSSEVLFKACETIMQPVLDAVVKRSRTAPDSFENADPHDQAMMDDCLAGVRKVAEKRLTVPAK